MTHHYRHLLLLWPRKLQFQSLPHQLLRQFLCSSGCVFIIVATKRIIIINVIQIGLTIIHWVSVRDGLTRKNCNSFGFCPNYHPPPIWTTCTLFFRRQNQDLKVSLEIKLLYIVFLVIKYSIYTYNLKKNHMHI